MKYGARYLHGWFMWARCIYMMRSKHHGAKAAPWYICFRAAASYRWLVDGQMRNGKFPRWLRQTPG